jgi:hypothetical protein
MMLFKKLIIDTWLEIKTFLVGEGDKFAKVFIAYRILYKDNEMVIFIVTELKTCIFSQLGFHS